MYGGRWKLDLFLTYFYSPDSPEAGVLDVHTDFKLEYFFHPLVIPESVSFFAKEVAEYKYGNSEEEAQEAGGEEEDEREEPEEGLEMDMDCAEGSPGESRY